MKRNYVGVAASLGFAQLALLTAVAQGQDRPATPLDEVVITASRSPKKLSEIGKVVRVIGAKQLAESQGRTITDVLNNVAGITLSGARNAPGANISLFTRGAGSGNTLVLIDGVPANNASAITGEYDISSIAIDQVERIEILKGGNSTLYGSDAVAGVINIITKQPGKFSTELLATGGTYGTFKQGFGVSGSVGKTGIAFNASNSNADGFSSAKDKSGNSKFDRDGFTQEALSGHIRQQFTDKFSVQGNLQFNLNKFDLDAGAFADDKDYTARNRSLFAGVTGKYILPKGLVTVLFNQNNVSNKYSNPGTGLNFSRQDNKGMISYTEAIWTQRLSPNFDITAGTNYRHMETSQAFESLTFNSYLPSKDANNSIFSTYASLFSTFGDFNLELGGRYNNHSQYGSNYTYTFNPSYVIANRFKIFAGVASAFKAPSLYHLTSVYKNANGLEPETTTSYEGGAELEIIPAAVTFNASVFMRDTKNLIYFYSDPVTFASEYRNGNKQEDKGFELELNTSPVKSLQLNGWYAYVKGQGTNEKNEKVNYLLRRPKNTFGANAQLAITKALAFNVIYKFTGSRLDPVGFPVVNVTQHNYHLFDAYVQVKPAKGFVLFSDFKNLFDQGYTEWEGYTTRGRNFNAGIRYTLD